MLSTQYMYQNKMVAIIIIKPFVMILVIPPASRNRNCT